MLLQATFPDPAAKTELFLLILNRARAVFTLRPRSLFQPFYVDKRKGNAGINNKTLTESLPLFVFLCKLFHVSGWADNP